MSLPKKCLKNLDLKAMDKKEALASSNKDKIKEVQNILSDWEILSLLDFPNLLEVEETESTLKEMLF